MTISKSLVMISKSLVMISKSLVNYSNSRNNIFQYIKLLVITSINVIFIIILIKIILYNYFKKSKKQIELNSAGIDSRIVSNDNINLKFEETINELKKQIELNSADIDSRVVSNDNTNLKFEETINELKNQLELNSAFINTLIENNDNINLKFEETINELKKQIELNSADIDSRVVSNDNTNLKFEETINELKNQLELNSAFINTLIENNDNINLKFEETANVSKQHMLDNNIDIYNHIANIERQFHNETAKISDCIAKIEVINHNILKTNTLTKINVLVEKINKYFEFFRELDLKKGETYKKKIYFEFKRINPQTNAELNLYDGFDCFSSVDPYEITPLLMKYFDKYYDKTIDKFYPLEFQVFAGDTQGTTLDWYDAEVDRQLKIVCDGNEFKKNNIRNITTIINNSGMGHIKLMNRNSVRLLDETDEEFEIKILQHILYELQDKYVFYKQIEFYTKPLEK